MKMLKTKNKSLIIALLFSVSTIAALMDSCKPTQQIAAKTGVQLWAENCQRCHNTPSPNTFSPEQWETIGMHMQTRALLTESERKKIVEFLKQ
jgi:cytochrome c2